MIKPLRPFVPLFASALGLLHGCAATTAPPDPVARQASAGDWLLEDRFEGGVRTVGMTRSTGGLTLQYRSFYATNGVHWRTTTLFGCRGWTNGTANAGYEALRRETRQIMETQLAACPRERAQMEADLQGFDAAFAATWKWEREAAGWAARSAAAIVKGPPGLNAAQSAEATAKAISQSPR
jgi:hypothetical protein